MYVNTVCSKETVPVVTGVRDLHFKASLLATSSPANMDVQVKHGIFFWPWQLVTHLISFKKMQQSIFLFKSGRHICICLIEM